MDFGRNRLLGWCLPALLLLGGTASAAMAAEKIFYPRPESASDPRVEYPLKLLDMALKKSGAQYELLPSQLAMQQGRALQEVEFGSDMVHIVWSMTSKEREQKTLPIRIPIYKGLIGWRLPLVTQNASIQFMGVKEIEDMKPFEAGQGHDWPDTEILRFNGLAVQGSPTYEGLFLMLEANRFHYFPRSVIEIWAEADLHAHNGVVIDSHIALHYPAAFYYFVNKGNTKLAKALTQGLEKSIADGSFDQLFHQYFDPLIKRSDLGNRTVIELKNPLLPALTPLGRKELWFQPQAARPLPVSNSKIQ